MEPPLSPPQEQIPDSLVKETDGGPEGNYPMRAKFEAMCREAQIAITEQIEAIDGSGTFREDAWIRPTGGGGMSRVLTDGNVFFDKKGRRINVALAD